MDIWTFCPMALILNTFATFHASCIFINLLAIAYQISYCELDLSNYFFQGGLTVKDKKEFKL